MQKVLISLVICTHFVQLDTLVDRRTGRNVQCGVTRPRGIKGYNRGMRGTIQPVVKLWRVYDPTPLSRRDTIIAVHFEGEKRLTQGQIESRLGQLEQARYRIAALESAMTEAGLELENPWDVIREDIANGVGGG